MLTTTFFPPTRHASLKAFLEETSRAVQNCSAQARCCAASADSKTTVGSSRSGGLAANNLKQLPVVVVQTYVIIWADISPFYITVTWNGTCSPSQVVSQAGRSDDTVLPLGVCVKLLLWSHPSLDSVDSIAPPLHKLSLSVPQISPLDISFHVHSFINSVSLTLFPHCTRYGSLMSTYRTS